MCVGVNRYLTGNPCTEYEGYKEFVIAALPQLKVNYYRCNHLNYTYIFLNHNDDDNGGDGGGGVSGVRMMRMI